MVVFTSICMNYLPKALVLGESLKKHNKDVKFVVVLLEREIPECWPKKADKIIDKITSKYGNTSILRASSLLKSSTIKNRERYKNTI